MTDVKIRELSRRFLDTESVDDECAWLAERVRVSEIPQPLVELLAVLGHEASLRLLGSGSLEIESWQRLFRTIEVWGKPLVVRATLPVVRHSLPLYEEAWNGKATRFAGQPADTTGQRVLSAVEAWLQHPSAETSERVSQAGRVAERQARKIARYNRHEHDGSLDLAEWVILAAYELANLVEPADPPPSDSVANPAISAAWEADSSLDAERVRDLVASALLPHLLGYEPPRSLSAHPQAGATATTAIAREADRLRALQEEGHLSDQVLRLAAHVGHEAARHLDGRPASHWRELEADWAKWTLGLEQFGKQACVRAMLAEAGHTIHDPDSQPAPVRAALDAAQAWVSHPSRETGKLALAANKTLQGTSLDTGEAHLAARCAWVASNPHPWAPLGAEFEGLRGRSKRESRDRLREAVRDELATWALEVGHLDHKKVTHKKATKKKVTKLMRTKKKS